MIVQQAHLVASYFKEQDVSGLDYVCLGAKPLERGAVGLDSSDQDVMCFDGVSGIVAYRNGLVLTDSNNQVTHHSISGIRVLPVLPTVPMPSVLSLKLANEQYRRLRTGFRPYFSSLQKQIPMMQPRLVAAAEREIEDYCNTRTFLNSVHCHPTMLFMRDGRLNAHTFPGPRAFDQLYRLMTVRGVRGVGIAKSANTLDVMRPYAKTIRKRVGDAPFAIPVLKEHMELAHPGSDSAFKKTLRHGSSNQAYGGVGAVRFALSISGDELCLVEFNLYDLEYFNPLVHTGHSLEQWAYETFGEKNKAIFSWDILQFVTECDWERLFIPTLEEIVYAAYTDTEIALYPRALANVHNRVKLRYADIEPTRRQWIVELGRQNISPDMILITLEDPHKTDPDIINYSLN